MDLWFLATALGAIVGAERLRSLHFQKLPFLRPGFATDLAWLATGIVALSLVMRAGGAYLAAQLGVPSLVPAPAPRALVVLTAVVLYDAGAYTSHWLLHRSSALWRLHAVHHSSRSLDWLASFRGHVLEHALRHLLSPVALLLLGFPLYAVAGASAIYGVWAAFGHSNLRLDLRRLEPHFITPRLHRLHHVTSSSGQNLGTIFSLWDRLRGTLLLDPAAPTEPLGVPGAVATYPQGWGRQLVEPFRPLPSSRTRCGLGRVVARCRAWRRPPLQIGCVAKSRPSRHG